MLIESPAQLVEMCPNVTGVQHLEDRLQVDLESGHTVTVHALAGRYAVRKHNSGGAVVAEERAGDYESVLSEMVRLVRDDTSSDV